MIFSTLAFGISYSVVIKLGKCQIYLQDLQITSDKQDYELKFYSTYLDMEWKDEAKEKRALLGQKQVINFNDQIFKMQALDYFKKCDYKFQRVVLLNALQGYDMYLDLKYHYLKEEIDIVWVNELRDKIKLSLNKI